MVSFFVSAIPINVLYEFLLFPINATCLSHLTARDRRTKKKANSKKVMRHFYMSGLCITC